MIAKRRVLFLTIGGCLLAVVFVRAITHSVILRIADGPMPGDHRLILWSPFRDREPERVAGVFLDRLKNGECSSAISSLGWDAEKQKRICQSEANSPINDVRLIDRRDHSTNVTLRYTWSDSGPRHLGSFIQVQVGGNRGDMRVEDYTRYY